MRRVRRLAGMYRLGRVHRFVGMRVGGGMSVCGRVLWACVAVGWNAPDALALAVLFRFFLRPCFARFAMIDLA